MHPLPIYDFLDCLKDSKILTKLDLKSGYHQIHVKYLHVLKITFKTNKYLFK
jgi:hypothetical protein